MKLSKFLKNKNTLKLLSIFFAIVAWFSVVTIIDDTTIQIVSGIPVEIPINDTQAQSYGLSVITGNSQTVDVRVKGTRVKLASLSKNDFVAYAVPNSIDKPGTYKLNVTVNKKNATDKNFDIISISPTTISVAFDIWTSQTYTVNILADKVTARDGYIKEKPYTQPDKIDITGPKTEIDKIKKVVVKTDLNTVVDDTVKTMGKLVLLDENDQEITVSENVELPSDEIPITIPVYKQKEVPLKPNFINVPASVDIESIKYTMSQKTINIAGSTKIIDDIDYLSLTEIDFRQITDKSIFTTEIKAYSGIINLDEITEVTVSFEDAGLSSKKLNISNVVIRNESAQYNVDIETNIIHNATIIGDKKIMPMLLPADFIGIVDLLDIDLAPGKMRVPITLSAMGKKQAWVNGEYSVTINVKEK